MADEDYDSLKDLLDGLDSEIAALSLDGTSQPTSSDVGMLSVPPTGGPQHYGSTEQQISSSLFNTPPLPFQVRAIQDYMDDQGLFFF